MSPTRISAPSPDRRWWEDTGAWWVAEEHEEVLLHLVLARFDVVASLDERGGQEIITRTGGRMRQEGLFG